MRKETAELLLRTINYPLKGRQKLLAPLVGLALLASCNVQDLSPLSQTSPSAVEGESGIPFDYCKPITDSSSTVEQALAGRDVPRRQITQDPEQPATESANLEALKISLSNQSRSQLFDRTRLQVVLVPVGYKQEYQNDEINKSMEYIEDTLKLAYFGVNVRFSHSNRSVQIGISAVQQLASFNDISKANRVIETVHQIYPVSKVIFVVNTSEYIGSCCPVIISGHSYRTRYLATHELGHDLGLSDGHKITYPSGEVNTEELFIPQEPRPTKVLRALNKVNAEAISTGNVCGTKKVSSYSNPRDNIMMEYTPSDPQLLSDLQQGKRPFNQVQKTMMNQDIEDKFEAEKNSH